MSCKVQFTETAKNDLREIAFYITEQSKEKSIAVGFVKELQEQCKILEQFPEIGSRPRDRVLLSTGYRYLVHKDYLIFYQYQKSENIAYVMAVFNGKRDYMRVMKKFL